MSREFEKTSRTGGGKGGEQKEEMRGRRRKIMKRKGG